MSEQLSLFEIEKTSPLIGGIILKNFAKSAEHTLLVAIESIAQEAPFRHMVTPGGYKMFVATTNCGSVGWITDHKGYRYEQHDPQSGKPWPSMPEPFLNLVTAAAVEAGYYNFTPDVCLINLYRPGCKLSLHQDKDEHDFNHPIVSVSLGIPTTFLFGGLNRRDRIQKILLEHGDVFVWGGNYRLAYHGIFPIKKAIQPLLGEKRINLTFRKAMPTV